MNGAATIIFDFDGTLANSLELIQKLYNEHVYDFGYEPLDDDEIPNLRRLGYKRAMKAKGIKMRKLPKMITVIGREMRQRMDEVVPFEGILQTLNELHDHGYMMGVLTSNQAPLVNEFFAKHNFPEFDFVVSEKTLFGKDKALRKIIKRYRLHIDQILYVGDEPRDVTACRKVGIPIIGVSWGLAGREGFESKQPDVIVDTPKELATTIKSLTQS